MSNGAAYGFRSVLAFFHFYDISEKVKTAKSKRNLKNTSQVLVELEAATWAVELLVPGTSDTVELYASPESSATLSGFSLEPQQEDIINVEVWIPTKETSQPVFAQIVVYCPPKKNYGRRVWERRIHFLLEGYHAQS